MTTKIYVAAHLPCDGLLKIEDPIYIPIHCGRAIYDGYTINNNTYLPELGDDTGCNISAKNTYYSELTAMYWIWKNDTSNPDDIVGLNHYRRYFSRPGYESQLIDSQSIEHILNDYNYIVDGIGTDEPDNTRRELDAIYYGFSQICNIQYLDIALIGIEKFFPDISNKFRYEIMHSGSACYCNMLIAKKKHFDEYASFLFTVLEYVESMLDLNNKESSQLNRRMLGYVGERLLRPWLIATKHSAKRCNQLFWEMY